MRAGSANMGFMDLLDEEVVIVRAGAADLRDGRQE